MSWEAAQALAVISLVALAVLRAAARDWTACAIFWVAAGVWHGWRD